MWVCNTHIKEVMTLLETPHVSKASYQIKCSFCKKRASAKVYYAHRTFQLTEKLYSSLGTARKQLV